MKYCFPEEINYLIVNASTKRLILDTFDIMH